MIFSFILEESLYIDALEEKNALIKKKNKTTLGTVFYTLLCHSTIYIFFCTFFGWPNVLKLTLIYCLIALPITLYYFYLIRRSAKKNRFIKIQEYRNNRILKEKTQITINDNGLSRISESFKVMYNWSDLKNIIRTKNFVFIYCSDLSELIIPIETLGMQLEGFNSLIDTHFKKKGIRFI